MSVADKLTLLANTKEALRVKLGLGTEVPFSQYVERAIRAPFSPLELFSGGKKGVWYDPSDLSTMFQDAAGTIPVTANGQPIGKILDKSGNGNHAVQTVSSKRMIYKTDGTLHWLESDEVDDAIVMPLALSGLTTTTLISYIRPIGTAHIITYQPNGQGSIHAPIAQNGSTGNPASNGETVNFVRANKVTKTAQTRGDVYTAITQAEVLSFSLTHGTNWGSEITYGVLEATSSYRPFVKTTGLLMVEGQVTDTSIDTYMAAKSGVTL